MGGAAEGYHTELPSYNEGFSPRIGSAGLVSRSSSGIPEWMQVAGSAGTRRGDSRLVAVDHVASEPIWL